MVSPAYEIGVKYALDKNANALLGGLWRGLRYLAGGNPAVFAKAAPAAAQAAGATGRELIQAGGGIRNTILNPAMQSLRGGVSTQWGNVTSAYRQGGLGSALNAARRTPLGRDVLWGSAIGGGANAAFAEPGDRLKAFGTGALAGGISGGAFRGIHAGATAMRNTAPMTAMRNTKGFTGLASRTLTQPTLLGTAASMALPTGAADVKRPGLPMSNVPGYY